MTTAVSKLLYKYKEFILSSDLKLNSDVFKRLIDFMKIILFTDVMMYNDVTTTRVLIKVINHFSAI